MLADDLLSELLARAEKSTLSGGRAAKEQASKLDAYWALSLKERDAFHERMRAAERKGAITIHWSKQGGDDRTADLISVESIAALATFLGIKTNADELRTAHELLAP